MAQTAPGRSRGRRPGRRPEPAAQPNGSHARSVTARCPLADLDGHVGSSSDPSLSSHRARTRRHRLDAAPHCAPPASDGRASAPAGDHQPASLVRRDFQRARRTCRLGCHRRAGDDAHRRGHATGSGERSPHADHHRFGAGRDRDDGPVRSRLLLEPGRRADVRPNERRGDRSEPARLPRAFALPRLVPHRLPRVPGDRVRVGCGPANRPGRAASQRAGVPGPAFAVHRPPQGRLARGRPDVRHHGTEASARGSAGERGEAPSPDREQSRHHLHPHRRCRLHLRLARMDHATGSCRSAGRRTAPGTFRPPGRSPLSAVLPRGRGQDGGAG